MRNDARNDTQMWEEELTQLCNRRDLVFKPSTPSDPNTVQNQLFGVSLSGGGIRSATFHLGILQGLAGKGLLKYADYLSTVSGGGYIGGWLHGLIRNSPAIDASTYEKFLACEDSKPGPARTDPLTFLRKYSNYLAPQLGFLSPDTWVIAAIWFRNTLLNQIILYLWIAGALLVPVALTNCAAAAAYSIAHRGVAILYHWLAFTSLACAVIVMAKNLGTLAKRDFDSTAGANGTDGASATGFSVWYTVILPLWLSSVALSLLCAGNAWREFSGIRLLSLNETTAVFPVLVLLFLSLLYFGGFWRCMQARKLNWFPATLLAASIVLICSSLTFVLLLVVWTLLQNGGNPHPEICIAVGPILNLFALVLGVILCVGLMGRDFPDSAREWTSSISARNLITAICWLSAFGIGVFSPPLIIKWFQQHGPSAYSSLIGWLGTTAAGVLTGKSSLTVGQASKNESRKSNHSVLEIVAQVAPPIAILGLLLAIATGSHILRPHLLGTSAFPSADMKPNLATWALAIIPPAVAALLSTRVNINEFSMNHFYKNRLVRCYLGASRARDRRPNQVTGFDPQDDFPIADLYAGNPKRPYPGPFPIINCALNLNHGKELAWQERKASSFIFTPLRCGYSPDDRLESAYVPTRMFTQSEGPYLGTAIAISGAAVNPNWGYHTNPATAFLLTVFNVRLGWWIGNTHEERSYLDPVKQPGPIIAIWPLLSELLGWTDSTSKYVNLSDGGHFDNLGLYELLRRRCKWIIAGDGEQDADYVFESLGGAVRKARIDFGIDVEISTKRILLDEGLSAVHCAVGNITYPATLLQPEQHGTLLYLKSSLTGDEPQDVTQYQKQHVDFPHQTTANQFFTESQFESYRQLGKHIVERVFERISEMPKNGAYDIVEATFSNLQSTWTTATVGSPGTFSRHADAYARLLRELADDADLRFLDGEIVYGAARTLRAPTLSQMNKGFLFCLRCIQLMENVYIDLGLEDDKQLAHEANAGWRKLFQHWTKGYYFDRTWQANKITFGAAFRAFYDRLI